VQYAQSSNVGLHYVNHGHPSRPYYASGQSIERPAEQLLIDGQPQWVASSQQAYPVPTGASPFVVDPRHQVAVSSVSPPPQANVNGASQANAMPISVHPMSEPGASNGVSALPLASRPHRHANAVQHLSNGLHLIYADFVLDSYSMVVFVFFCLNNPSGPPLTDSFPSDVIAALEHRLGFSILPARFSFASEPKFPGVWKAASKYIIRQNTQCHLQSGWEHARKLCYISGPSTYTLSISKYLLYLNGLHASASASHPMGHAHDLAQPVSDQSSHHNAQIMVDSERHIQEPPAIISSPGVASRELSPREPMVLHVSPPSSLTGSWKASRNAPTDNAMAVHTPTTANSQRTTQRISEMNLAALGYQPYRSVIGSWNGLEAYTTETGVNMYFFTNHHVSFYVNFDGDSLPEDLQRAIASNFRVSIHSVGFQKLDTHRWKMFKKPPLKAEPTARGADALHVSASKHIQEWHPLDETQTENFFKRNRLFLFTLANSNSHGVSMTVKQEVAQFLNVALGDLTFSYIEDDVWNAEPKDNVQF
jgi:hypothetical protein